VQIRNLNLNNGEEVLEITQDTQFTGLFVGHNSDSTKPRLHIIHRQPHLTSRIRIKAVVFDTASFDLEAKLTIENDAVGTDTYLKVDALIMSDKATARAVPSLEIKTDNVKGGHGATIGQVDQNQLQYLMSRGLDRATAENMIVEAFIADITF
jgi:Fe-S cluster assembly protein SufD